MTQTQLAAAADYAEALLTARRVKVLVTGLLLLVLVIQIAMFFLLRYWKPLPTGATPIERHTRDVIEYFVGLLDIAGLILPVILTVVLYLILKVQLVGRLVGTGRLTAAFLWSILLCLLLFPWQAVLNNPATDSDPVASSLGMKIPGVLYTWAEISHPAIGARFGITAPPNSPPGNSDTAMVILHWARYAGFPVLTVVILSNIHVKSRRGLRQSLGEDKNPAATNPPV